MKRIILFIIVAATGLSVGLLIATHIQGKNTNMKSKHMKIITIEEHFINTAITAATRDEIEKMAPSHARAFMADFGSRQTMRPEQLFDIGAGRIADMDENGIDAQKTKGIQEADVVLKKVTAILNNKVR